MNPTIPTSRRLAQSFLAAAFSVVISGASAEILDTFREYGNAADPAQNTDMTTPRFVREAGLGTGGSDRYTLTTGGSDYWGDSDNGSFAFDSTSAGQSGDFSAIVRSVSIAPASGSSLAGEWGRSGIGVRAVTNFAGTADPTLLDATSARIETVRKGGTTNPSVEFQGRPSAGNGANNTNFDYSFGSGGVTPVGTPVWMSISRYNGVYYSSWALDNAGVPGTWSSTLVAGSVTDQGGFGTVAQPASLTTGTVQVGIIHQAHSTPRTTTGVFDGLQVNNASNTANFVDTMLARGSFPVAATRSVSVNTSTGVVTGTFGGRELGVGAPTALSSTQRVKTVFTPTPGLKIDIYTGTNQANSQGWQTFLASDPTPYYSGKVTRNGGAGTGVYWGGDNYPAEWKTGGQFSAGTQENYSARMTGQIYIPEAGTYKFKDGSDDYSYLRINGQVLVDDNNWTSVTGAHVDGTAQGSPIVSTTFAEAGWYEIDFRMAEGGGGDNQALYWDYLPVDLGDPESGGTLGGNTDFPTANNIGAGIGALVPDGFLRSFEVEDDFADVTTALTNGNLGTLPAGEYTIAIYSADGSFAGFQTITVVPEPASISLGLLGAAALLRRRRR